MLRQTARRAAYLPVGEDVALPESPSTAATRAVPPAGAFSSEADTGSREDNATRRTIGAFPVSLGSGSALRRLAWSRFLCASRATSFGKRVGAGPRSGETVNRSRATRRPCAALAPALLAAALLAAPSAASAEPQAPRYLWPAVGEARDTLEARIAPPTGFTRRPAERGSFAEWLRRLPLRPAGTPIRLYDGRLKGAQDRHAAVVAIDTGRQNLQQCADAIMRLRAEYLLASRQHRRIAFNDTDGKPMAYRGGAEDRTAFDRYLIRVFSYAGTWSLEREMRRVPANELRAGDVFIKGGFPGHAVLVVDVVENDATGEKRFLLLQSFMPAQDMHILTDPAAGNVSPWYQVPAEGADLVIPDWIFKAAALRRFAE